MILNRLSLLAPYLCLFTASLLWASSFVALKLAFSRYDPMVVLFARMAVGSACFLLISRRLNFYLIKREDIKPVIIMVLFEPCLYFLFEAKALALTTASQVGMITALLPLMVSVTAFWMLQERLDTKTVIGLAVSVFGACWLSLGGCAANGAPNPPLGNLYEFFAMVCAVVYIIQLKKLTQRGYSPLALTALQAFSGTLFFFPALFFRSTTLPLAIEPIPALAILYLGSAVTFGAYGCYNYGVSKIPAGQATAFVNLIPVFTLIMGIAILKETLTVHQLLACLTVFAGLLLNRKKQSGFARL